MDIYRHCAVSFAGIIDLDKLSERITDRFPEASSEKLNLMNSIEAMRFRDVSAGVISFDGKSADFSMDVLCFRRHVIMVEYRLSSGELERDFLLPGFCGKQVDIRIGDEVSSNPLFMHSWMLVFQLLDFPDLFAKLSEVNIFDENSKKDIHRAFMDISLIDSYFLGDDPNAQTKSDIIETSVLCGFNQADPSGDEGSLRVYSGDNRVLFSEGVYSMSCDDPDFLNLYRYLIYRDQTLRILMMVMEKWLAAVKGQAVSIRENLNQTNKIYWSKLKRKLEFWDLNFLDVCASSVHSISSFDMIRIQGLSSEFSRLIDSRYESARNSFVMNLDTLKYAISNLKTPCESHDEQLLQSETEKVNERIMLLSFLAVSIPLLGAVFAPGIASSSKLIAALFLFSLPASYGALRGMQKRKSVRKATLDYLLGQRMKLVADRETNQKSLTQLSETGFLDDSTKSQTREYLHKAIEVLERQLENIDRDIRKLKGRKKQPGMT